MREKSRGVTDVIVVLLAALVASATGLVAAPATAAPVAFSYTLTGQ